MTERYDAIILGAGPAGLTAGIYLARNRLAPLIVDTGSVGGQMVLSYQVANYPGVETASGREISQTMARQARSFGAKIVSQAAVTHLDLLGDIKSVQVEDEGTFEAPVAILALGGLPRTLGLESEARLKGRGISYCATCDGDFFTDKPIVVVGGGNSALEEAVSLARYASRVTVVHVLDEWQAQPWAVEEAERHPKIDLNKAHRVLRFEGADSLEQVIVASTETGQERSIRADGAFVFIGYRPNTDPLRGVLDLTEQGEIVTDESMSTSLAGVFAAGDARAKRYRQITTAVADGTIAALSASEYLQSRERGQRLAAEGADRTKAA